VPFLAPETYAHKVRVLQEHCEREGRDAATITKAANVGYARDDADLESQFADMAKWMRPGTLMGRGQEVVDGVGAYIDAGAEWVILAVRAPFDVDGLERFAAEVIPAFR
jgi:alkanesulfonate monooxygenase SsuD/methylene tetrahydromethanopterin reductase-like flavin-dependent oxidoreductase (luciferase family)